MAQVIVSVNLAASAERVWEFIGGFHALAEWSSSIKSSLPEKGGRVRRLKTTDGAVIAERLESFSEAQREYSYTIVSGPIPVSNYHSTLKVIGATGGAACTVEWSSSFDAVEAIEEAMVEVFRHLYESAFVDLQRLMGI
ncbi:hypothetical protein AAKU55_003850 [Oxalobacteraceae bacterium GrIS 1.11]